MRFLSVNKNNDENNISHHVTRGSPNKLNQDAKLFIFDKFSFLTNLRYHLFGVIVTFFLGPIASCKLIIAPLLHATCTTLSLDTF